MCLDHLLVVTVWVIALLVAMFMTTMIPIMVLSIVPVFLILMQW
jgi:hypothetical protein